MSKSKSEQQVHSSLHQGAVFGIFFVVSFNLSVALFKFFQLERHAKAG